MDLLWTTLSEFPGEGCVGSGVGARKPENVAAVQCHLLYFILFFLLLAKLMRFLWLKESNYYEAFLLESQVVPHSWCHLEANPISGGAGDCFIRPELHIVKNGEGAEMSLHLKANKFKLPSSVHAGRRHETPGSETKDS